MERGSVSIITRNASITVMITLNECENMKLIFSFPEADEVMRFVFKHKHAVDFRKNFVHFDSI